MQGVKGFHTDSGSQAFLSQPKPVAAITSGTILQETQASLALQWRLQKPSWRGTFLAPLSCPLAPAKEPGLSSGKGLSGLGTD